MSFWGFKKQNGKLYLILFYLFKIILFHLQMNKVEKL